jgi:predicted Zn-dependent protease
VIAHESSHFLMRHQIRSWRDMKRKTDIFSFLAMGAGVAGGATGTYTGDLVRLAELGTVLSLFRYSRGIEAESDALGLKLLANAGYDPLSMSETWEQLISEVEESAKVRRKRVNRGYSLFASHPAPRERMIDLRASAVEMTVPGRSYDRGRARYLQALAPIRQSLVDDQVKLNDPGASDFVIRTLAKDGWNGLLWFAQGEINRLRNGLTDQQRAAQAYASAVTFPDAPADAWRWHGIMLMKAGRRDEGRAALQRYLAMAPSAPDAPFVRQMIVS